LYNQRRFVRRIKELHGEQTKNSNSNIINVGYVIITVQT
jgi:hypothetical protein